MTHDSIGLGEDGPTHQPVEHLASLRAMPNLTVIRPSDIIETMEAWEYALESSTPTLLVLTRQNLPMLRKKNNVNIKAKKSKINSDESFEANFFSQKYQKNIIARFFVIFVKKK